MSSLYAFSTELFKIAAVIGQRTEKGEQIQEKPTPPAPRPEKPTKEPGTGKIRAPKNPHPQRGYLSAGEVRTIRADYRKAGMGFGVDTSRPGEKSVAIMSPGPAPPTPQFNYRPPPAVVARQKRAREVPAPPQKPSSGIVRPGEPAPQVSMSRFNETPKERGNRYRMQQQNPEQWRRLQAQHQVDTSPVVEATKQLSGKGQVFSPDPGGRFVTPQPKPTAVGAPTVPSVVAKPQQKMTPERMAKLKAEMIARDKARAAKNRQAPGYANWEAGQRARFATANKERQQKMSDLRVGKTHAIHSNKGASLIRQLNTAKIPLADFNFYLLPLTGSYMALRKGQKPPRGARPTTLAQMK